MIIQQLSIFVENSPGRLAKITEIIAGAGVDIRALSIADTSDFGILRLIVSRPQVAIQALKEAGLTVSLTDVMAVAIDDTPGGLARVVRLMSDNGVTIEYMYAFVGRSKDGAIVILRVEDVSQGIDVLKKGGIPLLSSRDIYEM